MNSTSFIEFPIFVKNFATTIIESWFIPIDIVMIVCNILVIILSILFLFLIILDKTCHTVPMMLIANSCLSAFVCGCNLLGISTFTLENDLEQIEYQDSLCILRAYICFVACGLVNYSFLLQAIHRYVLVVYPNRLFWQSKRIQILFIVIIWIFDLIYPIPFMFHGGVIYDVNSQVCVVPLGLSFSIIYMSSCVYTIPILSIIFIYWKLVRHVHEMSKRVTTANILSRAERELKMVRRTVILVMILLAVCFPYEFFVVMSFFTSLPKYHFRIAFLSLDLSLIFVMITLFQFTDPLKTSLMKRIKRRPNVVIATMTQNRISML